MYEWAIEADLDAAQLLALNAAFFSLLAQMQHRGTLPKELKFYKAEQIEYEFAFLSDLSEMEPEGSA